MDKDFQVFDPVRAYEDARRYRERVIGRDEEMETDELITICEPSVQGRVVELGQRLLEMQRAARDLERERDAAVAREGVLREALETFPFQEYGNAQREGCDANAAWDCFVTEAEKHIRAVLATPSPAAEALLELARAAVAVEEIDGEMDGRERMRMHHALSDAVEKWRRARG